MCAHGRDLGKGLGGDSGQHHCHKTPACQMDLAKLAEKLTPLPLCSSRRQLWLPSLHLPALNTPKLHMALHSDCDLWGYWNSHSGELQQEAADHGFEAPPSGPGSSSLWHQGEGEIQGGALRRQELHRKLRAAESNAGVVLVASSLQARSFDQEKTSKVDAHPPHLSPVNQASSLTPGCVAD